MAKAHGSVREVLVQASLALRRFPETPTGRNTRFCSVANQNIEVFQPLVKR